MNWLVYTPRRAMVITMVLPESSAAFVLLDTLFQFFEEAPENGNLGQSYRITVIAREMIILNGNFSLYSQMTQKNGLL
jgi:hypothetical protein